MFERYSEAARSAVVAAQEEARLLGHAELGGEHLLMGAAEQNPDLLNVRVDALRSVLGDLFGQRNALYGASMPFTAYAKKSLEVAVEEAAYWGSATVAPAHLLLALMRCDPRAQSVVEAMGRNVEDVVRATAGICANGSRPSVPENPYPALRDGQLISVTLGDGLPVGDIGHPRADARVLLAMLLADGKAAELLREHGVDEAALTTLDPGSRRSYKPLYEGALSL